MPVHRSAVVGLDRPRVRTGSKPLARSRRPAGSIAAFLLAVAALWAAPGTSSASPSDLIAEVQELLASRRVQGLHFAMEFVPLESGERRASVSVAPDLPLVPASVAKIVTTLAALETFGPSHTFRTEVHRSGPLEGGVLQGDLGFVGEGDPYLTSERLWLLAHELRSAGLRRVEGDLVIHASGFPLDDATATNSLRDSDRSYAARPSGVAANFNCLTLRVTPGDRPGGEPIVAGDPYDLDYLEIDADGLRTGPPGGRFEWSLALEPSPHGLRYQDWADRVESIGADSTAVPPTFVLPDAPLEIARIRGVLPVGLDPQLGYRRARYPLPMVGSLLRAALAEFEIQVGGSIRIDTGPPSTRPWIDFPSVPLSDLIQSMNRYSSNFIANQLALAVHRERTWGPGVEGLAGSDAPSTGGTGIPPAIEGASSGPRSAEEGRSAPPEPLRLADAGRSLVRWLTETVPEASGGCVLFDGSGLSTDDRLTVAALTGLLVRSWDDLRLQPKLIASLPGPGEPGTLHSRFRDGERPVLWAKTGTLSDDRVSSLAGYFEDGAGEVVAFSILLNADEGSLWDVSAMRTLQEHWIEVYRN